MAIRSVKTGLFSRKVSVGNFTDPGSLPNLKLWLDAADTSTISLSGTSVTQWRDKSDNGYNFGQSTASAQPTSGVTTKNGLNVITFDGGDNLISSSSNSVWNFMHNSTGCTFFVVVEVTGTNNPFIFDNYAQDLTPGFYTARDHSTNRMNHIVSASSGSYVLPIENVQTGVFNANTWYYISILSDPANGTAQNRSKFTLNTSSVYANNTNTASVSTGTSTYAMRIGGPNYLTGKIAEIIVCSGLLPTNLLESTKSYLSKKWGI